MTRLEASAFLVLLALTSCTPQTFRADVGALVATVGGEIALQNAGGSLVLGDEKNDLDDQMGLGDTKTSPYVRLQWDHELHRVRVHGFGIDEEGSGVLTRDYGGLVAGSSVMTSMQFFAASAAYGYEVWGTEQFHLALGGQLGFYSLDIKAHSAIGREELVADLVAPMPFVEFETYIGDFTLGLNGGAMAADLGDGNGTYADFEFFSRYQITNEIEVIGGYRYLLMDGEGNASGRDFDLDIDVQGWFFGGGIRF